MNKKKKFPIWLPILIFVIIIAVVLYFLLQKPQNDSSTPTNGSSSNGKTVLLYWGLWEPESVMQPLIDEYEATHPNVEINYVQKSFTEYERNIFTRLKQGTTTGDPAPDILRINNTWLPKLENYLYPVPTSILSTTEYNDLFYPTAINDFTGTDGNLYAIPLEIDGLALFYNKELLLNGGYTEPPKDWESFIECSKKLTIRDANGNITQAGAGIGAAKNIKHSVDILNLLFLQNNVDITNSDGTVTLTGTRAISALKYYTDFHNTHKVWNSDLRWDLDMFYSGNLAMMFGPSWRAFDIIKAAPEIDFGIAVVPQLPNNESVNYSMYWGEAVSRRSLYPTEAWDFIKYLNEESQLKTMYSNSSKVRAFGEPYARKDMAEEISNNPYVSPILQMAPTMKSWKMGDQSYVENVLRTTINDVVVNGVNPSTAMQDAEDSINSHLAETEE